MTERRSWWTHSNEMTREYWMMQRDFMDEAAPKLFRAMLDKLLTIAEVEMSTTYGNVEEVD